MSKADDRCGTSPCARSSVVRSFRLADSLAAHQVVTSLIRARLSLAEARDTAQRQLAAEEKKKASKVGAPISRHSRQNRLYLVLPFVMTSAISGRITARQGEPVASFQGWFGGGVVPGVLLAGRIFSSAAKRCRRVSCSVQQLPVRPLCLITLIRECSTGMLV